MPHPNNRTLTRQKALFHVDEYKDDLTPQEVLDTETDAENAEEMLHSILTQLRRLIDDTDWKANPLTRVTIPGHRLLPELTHQLDQDYFEEIVRTGNKVDAIIAWTDSGKTQKIREELFTRAGNTVTQQVSKQYDSSGALVETLTFTFNRVGNKVVSTDVVRT